MRCRPVPSNEPEVRFQRNKRLGFLDKSRWKIIIPAKFRSIDYFKEGLSAACENDKYGYIDASGHYVILPVYSQARGFSDGRAAVCLGDKWGYIDKSGKFATAPEEKQPSL